MVSTLFLSHSKCEYVFLPEIETTYLFFNDSIYGRKMYKDIIKIVVRWHEPKKHIGFVGGFSESLWQHISNLSLPLFRALSVSLRDAHHVAVFRNFDSIFVHSLDNFCCRISSRTMFKSSTFKSQCIPCAPSRRKMLKRVFEHCQRDI